MRLKITKRCIQVDGQDLALRGLDRDCVMIVLFDPWSIASTAKVPVSAQLRRIAATLVKWADDMDAAKRKGGK